MTKDQLLSLFGTVSSNVARMPVDGLRHWMFLPSSAPAVLIAELWVEPHVYLHEAELTVLSLDHAASQTASFRDQGSAAWRQIAIGAGDVALAVSWTAIANATPGVEYIGQLSVRDAHCRLLATPPDDMNPLRLNRLIGPETQPTDRGQLWIGLRDTENPAGLDRRGR